MVDYNKTQDSHQSQDLGERSIAQSFRHQLGSTEISGLWIAAFFLIGLGCVQVYSSSFIFASEVRGDGLFFFRRQLGFAVLSIGVLAFVSALSERWLYRLGTFVFFSAVAAVGLTLVPGLGVRAGGAVRWLKLPAGFVIEPSELLKVSAPFFAVLALSLRDNLKWARFVKPASLVVFIVCAALLLKQPDFGTLVILTLTGVSVLFVAGLSLRWFAGFAAAGAVAFYFLVARVPYRWARIQSFLDPWSVASGDGFQAVQSMLSIRAGGLTGVGLGEGQGKLFFLPEAHTDFTLAVLGEELGFIGLASLLVLYGFCVYRGMRIATTAFLQSSRGQQPTGSGGGFLGRTVAADGVLASALTAVFGLSVLINSAVTLGLLPTKGLTLPFLSYGGSSALASGLLFGVLLNIERRQKQGSVWGRK